MKCAKHPKYKGLRDPKVKCDTCNQIRIRTILEQLRTVKGGQKTNMVVISEKLKEKLIELYV